MDERGETTESLPGFLPGKRRPLLRRGRLNDHGHQIKNLLGRRKPSPASSRAEHAAIPGLVYGGLIASLIDCHCTGTAAAAAYRAENPGNGQRAPLRCDRLCCMWITSSPLRPVPGLRGGSRKSKVKVVVAAEVSASGVITARGEVVAVQMPDTIKAWPATWLAQHPASRPQVECRQGGSAAMRSVRRSG